MFKHIQEILFLLITACITYVAGNSPLNFTGASWIWVAPTVVTGGIPIYPPGNVTFRRDWKGLDGFTPLSADILITADNAYTLYVNGVALGTGRDTLTSNHFRSILTPQNNVFAVTALNNNPSDGFFSAAGLIVSILIRYTDGFTTERVVTDNRWLAVTGTPTGFQQVQFNDAQWPAAYVEGPYPTTVPWLSVNIPPFVQDPGPSFCLTCSKFDKPWWIWTEETSGIGLPVPTGSRVFRKTIKAPTGQLFSRVNIYITASTRFTLYINGLLVGAGQDVAIAFHYVVDIQPSPRVVIAVFVENVDGLGGFIATGETLFWDSRQASVFFTTDSTWLFLQAGETIPPNWIATNLDDSQWSNALFAGSFGDPPFDSMFIPDNHSLNPPSAALPNAPFAPPASVQTSDTPVLPHLQLSQWIWSEDEEADAGAVRAFRTSIKAPLGKLFSQATIYITANDQYTLYVNGQTVGSGVVVEEAQEYDVTFKPIETVVVAVFVRTTDGDGGLVVAGNIVTSDGKNNVYFISDTESWTCQTVFPDAFILPGFDDSAWLKPFFFGMFGTRLSAAAIPDHASPQSSALPGAPVAPPATVRT